MPALKLRVQAASPRVFPVMRVAFSQPLGRKKPPHGRLGTVQAASSLRRILAEREPWGISCSRDRGRCLEGETPVFLMSAFSGADATRIAASMQTTCACTTRRRSDRATPRVDGERPRSQAQGTQAIRTWSCDARGSSRARAQALEQPRTARQNIASCFHSIAPLPASTAPRKTPYPAS